MGSARTTVRAVEWNVSHLGFLIPRVLFDPIILSGATIAAATGLHGRWIYDNVIGPGAEIEVRRAGDVIPQIIAVHSPGPDGPAMPPRYVWADADATTSIHIKPFGEDSRNASNSIKIAHALGELGAENVGPGIVAKLYAAGYRTLNEIYAATSADFAARLEGIREKGADRIYQGLRASAAGWTTLNFLVASSTMPRGVGHSKLAPLLAINPRVETWTASQFKAAKPAGLSDKTIDAIIEAVPAYLAWFATTGFAATATSTSTSATATSTSATTATAAATVVIPVLKPSEQMVVVFTGVRDKALEAYLEARGHIVADSVTKRTTHVIHADNSAATSGKITKAEELGIPILSLSEFKANLGL
jgi:DNA ligase (NAD+)